MLERAFSDAPTVITFFADVGEPSESKSISPFLSVSLPSLAAANKITSSSWVRALASACMEEVVVAVLIRPPRVGVDPAPVGPCEPKEVVQVVWDAEQFLLTVVRRCYGMEEEIRFGCSSDDVAVLVRAIAQDRTSIA